MDGNNKKLSITAREIALISMLTALLFAQEQVLTFIPNVQFTVFLLVLYSKKLGFYKTSIIIVIHVILDNLVMGSFNLAYTPAMLLGWLTIPLMISTVFRKTDSSFLLALAGLICSFLYCWMFIIPSCLIYKIDLFLYIASDIIFEIIMATCSFVSIFLLYKPCSKTFDHFKLDQ